MRISICSIHLTIGRFSLDCFTITLRVQINKSIVSYFIINYLYYKRVHFSMNPFCHLLFATQISITHQISLSALGLHS